MSIFSGRERELIEIQGAYHAYLAVSGAAKRELGFVNIPGTVDDLYHARALGILFGSLGKMGNTLPQFIRLEPAKYSTDEALRNDPGYFVRRNSPDVRFLLPHTRQIYRFNSAMLEEAAHSASEFDPESSSFPGINALPFNEGVSMNPVSNTVWGYDSLSPQEVNTVIRLMEQTTTKPGGKSIIDRLKEDLEKESRNKEDKKTKESTHFARSVRQRVINLKKTIQRSRWGTELPDRIDLGAYRPYDPSKNIFYLCRDDRLVIVGTEKSNFLSFVREQKDFKHAQEAPEKTWWEQGVGFGMLRCLPKDIYRLIIPQLFAD